jgi:hypothetical protein
LVTCPHGHERATYNPGPIVTPAPLPGALLQSEFVLTTTVQQALQCLTPQGTETNSGVLTGFSLINL